MIRNIEKPRPPLSGSLIGIGVKLLSTVPQYVIEREVPGAGALSEIQIRDMSLRSLQTLKEIGPQIQWLRKSGIPADRIAAVRRMIDPKNLK